MSYQSIGGIFDCTYDIWLCELDAIDIFVSDNRELYTVDLLVPAVCMTEFEVQRITYMERSIYINAELGASISFGLIFLRTFKTDVSFTSGLLT